MMIKIMQKEDIFEILEKDFPDLEMNTANEVEVEVHKYMREISRKFLEKKLQEKINKEEKELIKKNDKLETINIQKKT
jgi:hypothetical protein